MSAQKRFPCRKCRSQTQEAVFPVLLYSCASRQASHVTKMLTTFYEEAAFVLLLYPKESVVVTKPLSSYCYRIQESTCDTLLQVVASE